MTNGSADCPHHHITLSADQFVATCQRCGATMRTLPMSALGEATAFDRAREAWGVPPRLIRSTQVNRLDNEESLTRPDA